LIFFIKLKYHIEYTNATTVNIITFGFDIFNNMYKDITKLFNDYSIENDLDIQLKANIFSSKNITQEKDSYDTAIDSLLNKRTDKYDIYIFDPVYLYKYYHHLENLNNYLSPEHLNQYLSHPISELCIYNNEYVGIVNTLYIFHDNN